MTFSQYNIIVTKENRQCYAATLPLPKWLIWDMYVPNLEMIRGYIWSIYVGQEYSWYWLQHPISFPNITLRLFKTMENTGNWHLSTCLPCLLCGNDMGGQVQYHMVSSYGKCMDSQLFFLHSKPLPKERYGIEYRGLAAMGNLWEYQLLSVHSKPIPKDHPCMTRQLWFKQ